ncbi:MAG: diaminopropionate ammonia-lyase [Alphaproteobacteria bacterium]|nr:diaminopropionate ammonia-lyase [Alphaproteobacteria bacterium]
MGTLAGGRELRVQVNSRWSAAAPFGPAQKVVMDPAAVAEAVAEIRSWPSYAPTPLHTLPGLAHSLGLGALWCKDEGRRFGLGSFKALGGAYAVFRHLAETVRSRTGTRLPSVDLLAGRHAAITGTVTVTTATDGNHGRSVAWGASMFGCRCVIYMHEGVSEGRADVVRGFGAEVVRTPGTYDDSVRLCAADAARLGRQVISDTTFPGYTTIPCTVMHGYGVMVAEMAAQLPAGERPTHLFVQGGCGGFAAAVQGAFWSLWGSDRPRLVTVEPVNADCIWRSGQTGRLTQTPGALDTVMGGLACGEVSAVAWPILETGTTAFLALGDDWAVEAMRRLAAGDGGDLVIVAGEAGAAGVAALLALAGDAGARATLGLDARSRVLTFISEGATDQAVWRSIVGRDPMAA